jgi:hypothetical protein
MGIKRDPFKEKERKKERDEIIGAREVEFELKSHTNVCYFSPCSRRLEAIPILSSAPILKILATNM